MARQGNHIPVTRTGSLPPRISKSARSTSRPKRPPGRPFKLPRSTSASTSSSRSGRSGRPSASPSVAPTPPRRTLSMLEALPRELIEQIFLYSLNLNLPRASPALAAALSREHIYKLLIILACWDDPPDASSSYKGIGPILAPLDYIPLGIPQRAKLQEDVFRCRFCTLDRVRDQIPTMMLLTIRRQWINNDIVMEPDQQEALEQFMERKDNKVATFQGKGPPVQIVPQIRANPELLRRAQQPGLHEYELCVNPMTLIEYRSKTLGTTVTWPALNLKIFPPNLLRGGPKGFSAADVEFLEMLRITSGNTLPPFNELGPCTFTTVDRRALHTGVNKAIVTQNFVALETLLKIDELFCRFHGHRTEESVFYTIPSEHYLTVIRLRCDPIQNVRLFQTLLRASAESMPIKSTELTQWMFNLVSMAEQDPAQYGQISKFVHWLMDFYIEIENHIEWARQHPSGALFYQGLLDPNEEKGRKYIDAVYGPGAKPPKRYIDETSFDAKHWWLKQAGSEVPPHFVRSPPQTGP
ncbi:uncharacterized protein N7443_000489 [Penicillium atrosanguineum]|uniref:Uncharacterized protein n=1 Tax=Penicillium atrosanguineum TaxID=1132637 RepID=A0A9W9QBR5_9EURO|nr:uncharacterized protein N7443_000489 [Penicillium atrosanguineum]KAJ5147926.1 hypothetical protein N7526_001278 [Penicillium atrosanguineum]KAJ5313605.1 hypothetical protein N7443_000489 [Penicillium atrosanguineum]KAJ5330779.1 hypothetical protein N7476_000562 [Penicillium atrosanguineum]